jgi:UDP-glucose 4-epimerase
MVLVFGGAGYVGSHVCLALRTAGVDHLIADNFEAGHRGATHGSDVVECDLRSYDDVRKLVREAAPTAVMLFAGYISVGQSSKKPLEFYANNVAGPIHLLRCMAEAGVQRLVFSSSAAVYGEPETIPIPESHPLLPTNAYGETKLAIERALFWAGRAHSIDSCSLRYFNAAGADPEGRLGEDHDPEEHLLPLAIDAALGRRPPLTVFGDDYPTPDGTCIRDYVHVSDLAEGHLRALDHLKSPTGGSALAVNLGSGTGHSVSEVLDVVGDVVGTAVPHTVGARREGDPARLVASNEKANSVLGWQPRHTLRQMVEHATAWRRAHPNGYGDA